MKRTMLTCTNILIMDFLCNKKAPTPDEGAGALGKVISDLEALDHALQFTGHAGQVASRA